MFPSDFSREIFETKYAGKHKDWASFCAHLGKVVGLGNPKDEETFTEIVRDMRFLAGGRILAYNGRPDSRMSLMNCTTHAIEEDTLEAIADTMLVLMRASSRGQGIGIDLSKLRPRDSVVNNAARTSTGAVSFMELLNTAGDVIGQDGRRAAILFSLRVDHPDIWRKDEKDMTCPRCNGQGCVYCNGSGYIPYDFLHIKSVPHRVENANISVFVTDEFMRAVLNDEMFTLRALVDTSATDSPIYYTRAVPAKRLFMELARCAWQSAEPAVLFKDTIARMSNSDLYGDEWKIVGTNACSEEPLDQDGVCNLGSLNLVKYVTAPFTSHAQVDYARMVRDIRTAVRFLDNVLTVELSHAHSASARQRHSIEQLRRIGLGVMGYADMLTMLGLPYRATEKTLKFTRELFAFIRDASYQASIDLARERGAFPALERLSRAERERIVEQGFYATLPAHLKSQIVEYGMRNVTVLSIAPTGSISNLAGVTSGIEPLFAREFVRRVRMKGKDEFVNYVHPQVILSRVKGLPDDIWQTAYDVPPVEHVIIQGVIQEYIDASISKTVNLPATATIQDVADVFMEAWKRGLKGVTVYRDGSRTEAVLYTTAQDTCPVCHTPLVRESGCVHCPSCGYGRCE